MLKTFKKIMNQHHSAHAGPSHSGRGSRCAGIDPVGCNDLGDYNDEEGTALGCESEGGTWAGVGI
jgi:hypothetical protein